MGRLTLDLATFVIILVLAMWTAPDLLNARNTLYNILGVGVILAPGFFLLLLVLHHRRKS